MTDQTLPNVNATLRQHPEHRAPFISDPINIPNPASGGQPFDRPQLARDQHYTQTPGVPAVVLERAGADPDAPLIVHADSNLAQLASVYRTAKQAEKAAEQAYNEAKERADAVKLELENRLYNVTSGAPLADLRVPGTPGALRMRLKARHSVDSKRLQQLYPRVYADVERVTEYWELRSVTK